MTPRHVGDPAQDLYAGRFQAIVQRDDIVVFDGDKDSSHRIINVAFDELDASRIAKTEQATTSPAVTGRPFVSDGPSEQLAVKVTRGIKGSGESDNT